MGSAALPAIPTGQGFFNQSKQRIGNQALDETSVFDLLTDPTDDMIMVDGITDLPEVFPPSTYPEGKTDLPTDPAAVPEPSSFLILITALLALPVVIRRCRGAKGKGF
jgi:hypothetical protein